ncbi:MAG: MFS transporter [Acidimicrobiales bacterium]
MWVLGLVVMIDQVDQNIVRGAASPIQHAFHLSDFGVGLLLSCYTIANGVVSVPAGYLADRWRRRRGIAGTLVGWSCLTALTAAAWNYGALLGVRTALGFGQALTEPSASSLLADLYPHERRGRAFSVQQCLSYVGFGLGLGLGGLVAARLGWRAAFLVVGLPGAFIAWAVLGIDEPTRGASDRQHLGLGEDRGFGEDLEVVPSPSGHRAWRLGRQELGGMVSGLAADFRTIVKIPTMAYALVGVSALLFTVTAVGSALPQFYEHQLGRSTGQAALFVGLLLVLGGVPGVLLGGRIADRLAPKIRGGRMAVPAICLLAGEAVFVVSFFHMAFAAVYCLELAGTFLLTLAVPALKAGISDVLPAGSRGAGFAAFNIVSVIAGQAAASVIVFSIAGALGNDYRSALLAVSPGVATGALVLFHARKHLDRDVAKIFQAIADSAASGRL